MAQVQAEPARSLWLDLAAASDLLVLSEKQDFKDFANVHPHTLEDQRFWRDLGSMMRVPGYGSQVDTSILYFEFFVNFCGLKRLIYWPQKITKITKLEFLISGI